MTTRHPGTLSLSKGVLSLLLLCSGCVAYNDPCSVVENEEEVLGTLGEDVWLDKPHARHANNAIGDLAADAYRFRSAGGDAEVGVINGGGIRAEGFCGVSYTTLEAGPLTSGALHEILLFDNHVVTLDVTVDELVRILAAGVAGLSESTQPIVSGPGNFLHLSEGSAMTVDCGLSGTPSPGRITQLTVGTRTLVSGGAVVPGAFVRLAITDFLINFGGGTSDVLRGLDADPTRRPQVGGIDSDLAEERMREHYGDRGVALVRSNRIDLQNCQRPDPP